MKEKTLLKLAAMVAICYLETLALVYLRIDGALLSGVVALIAGLSGYSIGKKTSE